MNIFSIIYRQKLGLHWRVSLCFAAAFAFLCAKFP